MPLGEQVASMPSFVRMQGTMNQLGMTASGQRGKLIHPTAVVADRNGWSVDVPNSAPAALLSNYERKVYLCDPWRTE